MPSQTSARSSRRGSLVIAAIMILCLLACLGLAQMLIHGSTVKFKTVDLGPISLLVPGNWQQSGGDSPLVHSDNLALFKDARSGAKLFITALHDVTPRTPIAALEGIHNTSRLPIGPNIRGFRNGPIIALSVSDSSGSYQLAVLTFDARRYYVLLMDKISDEKGSDGPSAADLFETICRSLTIKQWRQAQADERVRVGLPADGPPLAGVQNVLAMQSTNRGATGVDPITLVSNIGPADLAMLRLLPVIDTSTVDPKLIAEPGALLSDALAQILGRRPRGGEIRRIQIDDHLTWRAKMTSLDSTHVRCLWYVRFSEQRAALFETLATVRTSQRVDSWIRPLIDVMAVNLATRSDDPTLTAAAAMARGEQLARHMRAEFAANHPPAVTYSIVQRNSQFVGLGIHRILPRPAAGPPLLKGNLLIYFHQPAMRLGYAWQAEPDGSAIFIEHTRPQRTPGATADRRTRLQLIDRDMSVTQLQNGKWQPSFSATVPESYIPPIVDERWSVSLLEASGGQTALVWLSYGLGAPQPHWLAAHRDEDGKLVMRLRPVMRLETDTYVLDEDGHIEHQQYYDDAGHLLGPTMTNVHYVDRDTLLREAPDARPLLDRLEAVTNDHD